MISSKELLPTSSVVKKADRLIFSLQETHVAQSKISLVKSLWREGLIFSHSLNNARGVLTFYSNSLFDCIKYEFGDSNGRSTWLIGDYNSVTELFVNIYAPNSGTNLEFYQAFFKKVNNLVNQHKVDNVYISGDLNLELIDKGINLCS